MTHTADAPDSEHNWQPVQFVAWERGPRELLVVVCLDCATYAETWIGREPGALETVWVCPNCKQGMAASTSRVHTCDRGDPADYANDNGPYGMEEGT